MPSIYKYFSKESYFLNLMEKQQLFFNSFRSYNDPFEIFTIIKDKKTGEYYAFESLKDIFKACCFSLTKNEYLLWSHYGNNHQGFCVEINLDNYFSNTRMKDVKKISYNDEIMFGFPIKYRPYEDKFSFTMINEKIAFEEDFTFKQSIELTKHKFKVWAYEKEYRLIIIREQPCSILIPKESIKSIIFGFSISDKKRKRIESRIKSLGYTIPIQKIAIEFSSGRLI